MKNQTAPMPEKLSIMFADIRGYSDLVGEENTVFHNIVFNQIWELVVDKAQITFRDQNTWGDGIFCCHSDSLKLAQFAVELAAAFDHSSKTDEISHPLRLRVALHIGYVHLGASNPVRHLPKQYHGISMVVPARLEPVVRPGQVWCTKPFSEALSKNAKQLASLEIAKDELREVQYAKDHGEFFTYRLRKKRKHENDLLGLEKELKSAIAHQGNVMVVRNIVTKLISRIEGNFATPSVFMDWEELCAEMIRFRHFRSAIELLNAYREWIESSSLDASDVKILLLALLARAHLGAGDPQAALEYMDQMERGDQRTELELLRADVERALSLDSRNAEEQRTRLLNAEQRYIKVAQMSQTQREAEARNGKRLVGVAYYAELDGFRSMPLALAGITNCLLEAVTPHAGEREKYRDKYLAITKLLLEYFVLCPPTSPAEYAAYAISAVLSGRYTVLQGVVGKAIAFPTDSLRPILMEMSDFFPLQSLAVQNNVSEAMKFFGWEAPSN